MTTPSIQKLLKGKRSIPTIPEIVLRVRDLIDDPNSGTTEIGALVREDAPLAAKVLRMANSAYYGLQGVCVSTEQACTVLGMRSLRNIITHVGVMESFKHLDDAFDVQGVWDHSVKVARLSEFIGERLARSQDVDISEVYTCGLLHDIGKMILLDIIGEPYAGFLEEVESEDDLVDRERGKLGFDHADMGAHIAAQWGLPDVVRLALQYHHGPPREEALIPTVAIVYVADRLIHEVVHADTERIQGVFHEPMAEALTLNGLESFAAVDHAFELEVGAPAEDEEEVA